MQPLFAYSFAVETGCKGKKLVFAGGERHVSAKQRMSIGKTEKKERKKEKGKIM